MNRLLLLATLCACSGPLQEPQLVLSSAAGGAAQGEAKATPAEAEKAAPPQRLPARTDVPCFPCHSRMTFESGPFPHKLSAHKSHCHVCHELTNHRAMPTIDRSACLKCHEEDASELKVLQKKSGKKRK